MVQYKFKSMPEAGKSGLSYLLVANPNEMFFNAGKKDIKLVLSEKIEQAEILATAKKGETISAMNKYTAHSTEALYIGATVLGLDPSGSISKFSQMSKLYSRYRMINLNFG